MSANKWEAKARKYARKHGLGEWFVRQMRHESVGFNEDVIAGRRDSPKGARGIAQIMPATAKGWGVDPLDPDAALDAAARNMRRYVKEYGSVEKALRAYNAGPGAIEKSRGYRETNKYVAVILGRGGDNPKLKPPQKDSAPPQRLSERATSGSAAVDGRAAFTQSVALGFLQRNKGPGQGLIDVVRNAQAAAAQALQLAEPAATPPPSSGKISAGKTGGKGTGRPSAIKELFYDPIGGWDNGTAIGSIGGHEDHVHLAAHPRRQKWLQQRAKKHGLTITSTTGGKHTEGSFHYQDSAFDASGSPEQMAAFVNDVRRKYKLK